MKKESSTQTGFTMIETLVSLIVISIGILGFALLQIEALKATKTATERSKAIHYATDMMDRIRANKDAITSYTTPSIAGPGTGAVTNCADPLTTPVVTASTAAANINTCTPTQMSTYEIRQWRTSIADPIIGFGDGIGKGGITVTGTDPWSVQISISWTDKADAQTYILSSAVH